MKFGLKFREGYADVADGNVGEEFDNIVAFLQVLWDKILDSEGNIKTLVTNNNQYGGAGVVPTFQPLNTVISNLESSILGIASPEVHLQTTTVTLAERLAAASSPVVIVPGILGRILIPIGWAFEEVRGGVAFSLTATFSLQYTGVIAANMPTIATGSGTSFYRLYPRMGSSGTTNLTASFAGLDLVLVSNVTPTGGTGTTTRVHVIYASADPLA